MSEVNAVYIEHGKRVGGAPNKLGNMLDVNLTDVTSGQVIVYDATNTAWINQSIPSPEGKADKVSGATNGDLAALDSNGNLADSGVKLSISSPTSGQALIYDSTNSVWSNTSIPSPEGKADKVSGAVAGNLAALDANGNLVDSGYSVTTLSGTIPVNPSSTSGMNIWIET